MSAILDNTQIVLVRAENPMNIGQTARALKNFGLKRLTLVDCAPHQVQEAYTLGWNAKNIIDGARVCKTVKEAVGNSALVAGFTRRSGHARGEPKSFLEVLPQILETAESHEISLLFGNERNGLSNEELHACHWAVTIPTGDEHGSLNLSHAAAIAAFLIFSRTPDAELHFRKPERIYATQSELEELLLDFKGILEILDYQDLPLNDLMTRTLGNLSRLFKKAGIERREFHLLKAFLSRIERKIVGAQFIAPESDGCDKSHPYAND